jgi:ribonuclease HI
MEEDTSQSKKGLIIFDACCHIEQAHMKGRKTKGKSACGVIIIDENGRRHERSKYLGEMTPPQAEFSCLKYALDVASGILKRDSIVEVRSDSELVIKWMNKEFRLKKEHIRALYDDCKKLEARFSRVEYNHHPRGSKFAKDADKVAQKCYDSFLRGEDTNND